MKELNKIVLGKGLFASIKGELCLTKWHLDNHKRQLEIEYPLTGSCFWLFWFKLRFFFKMGLFNKGSDPWTLIDTDMCYKTSIGQNIVESIPSPLWSMLLILRTYAVFDFFSFPAFTTMASLGFIGPP